MNVVVTGGAGFIGSHLVDRLIELGHNVLIIDDLSSGSKNNINEKAVFIEMDICDNKLIDIMKNHKPEIVFHLAAQTSVNKSIIQPIKDAQTNIIGSLNLIEACVETKVKKLIYSSSAAVYGFPLYLPVDEKHSLIPLSQYGMSKYAVENYLALYSNLYNLDFTVLRYANVYGPRQDASAEGGVVAIFFNQALLGLEVQIYGDGNQTRDFIYVYDVIEANLKAVNSQPGCVYNIGTGIGHTINQLLATINTINSTKCKFRFSPERKGDIKHSILSISKAQFEMDFSPRYDLIEGISDMHECKNKESNII